MVGDAEKFADADATARCEDPGGTAPSPLQPLQWPREEGPALRCVLVCTHKTFTKGRSIFSHSTENGPAFPYSSRVQPRSQEKCQPVCRGLMPRGCVPGGVCRERINALNGLEQTCYSTRNNLEQKDLADKLTAEESEALDAAVKGALAWLDEHGPTAEAAAVEEQQKELEVIVHPIMTRLYAESEGDEQQTDGEEDTSTKE